MVVDLFPPNRFAEIPTAWEVEGTSIRFVIQPNWAPLMYDIAAG